MNTDLLRIKPQNLPVYVYHLDADVALVHNRIAYKLRRYFFSRITVAANQPLRVGDVLTSSFCYYGNSDVEIIPHLHKKNELGKSGIVLRYYYGCQIDKMAIAFVDMDEEYRRKTCWHGRCTVFIELSDSSLSERIGELDNRWESLTEAEHECLRSLRKDQMDSDSIDYWKKRIPDWDERFECLGEIPADLSY